MSPKPRYSYKPQGDRWVIARNGVTYAFIGSEDVVRKVVASLNDKASRGEDPERSAAFAVSA